MANVKFPCAKLQVSWAGGLFCGGVSNGWSTISPYGHFSTALSTHFILLRERLGVDLPMNLRGIITLQKRVVRIISRSAFDMLQYFEMILPQVESLWSS